MFKILLILVCLFEIFLGATASVAINAMNRAVSSLNDTIKDQNKEFNKIVNLEKFISIGNRKANFMTKQRNELLLNSLYIESEIKK